MDRSLERSAPPLVRDLMARDPVTIAPDRTIAEVALLMDQRRGGAFVVGRDCQVEGIFTDRDLLRGVPIRHRWDSTPVASIMTPDPVTIEADQTWTAALDLLSQHRVRNLPVVERGRLVGMLSLYDLMQHRAHQLEWLVWQRTSELEAMNTERTRRIRQMEHNLGIAATIQRQLLPVAPPELPPFTIGVGYEPLEQVSGDSYYFAALPPDRLGLLILDSSGHGVPAAFVAVMAKMAFLNSWKLDSPAAVVRSLNVQLAVLSQLEQFITLCYAVVDRRTLRFTYTSAGHLPPLWYRREPDTVEALDAGSLMIGVVPQLEFEDYSVQLGRGDVILLYTDGVVESQNDRGEPFGQQRLAAFLRRQATDSGPLLACHLAEELARFRGSHPPADDMTCIALCIPS